MKKILFGMVSLIGLLAGCSSNKGPDLPTAMPVKGKVIQGGSPVTAGRVVFHPQNVTHGIEPFAEIQQDGTFTLTSYQYKDGVAPPGDYVVTVEPFTLKTGQLKKLGGEKIPRRYWDTSTSTLKVTIHDGDNDVVLTLK